MACGRGNLSRGVMAVNVLVAEASTGAKNRNDFIALAKKQPGALAYGSAGTGTSPYLGVRKFEDAASVKFLHAPYKGVAPAYQDLFGARLQVTYVKVLKSVTANLPSSRELCWRVHYSGSVFN